MERALQAGLTDRRGHEKHDPAGHYWRNSRNRKSHKKRKGEFAEIELETPRDRNDTFEPKIVAKGQTREILGHLEEVYGVEVSATLISDVN